MQLQWFFPPTSQNSLFEYASSRTHYLTALGQGFCRRCFCSKVSRSVCFALDESNNRDLLRIMSSIFFNWLFDFFFFFCSSAPPKSGIRFENEMCLKFYLALSLSANKVHGRFETTQKLRTILTKESDRHMEIRI